MPLVPYPNPQKVGKIQKKFGFFPYKSKNDGLQEKTYRPSHLVRPQGLVGSPKASVIASHASCLAKKDERQPGVPGFATQCVVQHSCKVPDDIKKQQPCCYFLCNSGKISCLRLFSGVCRTISTFCRLFSKKTTTRFIE